MVSRERSDFKTQLDIVVLGKQTLDVGASPRPGHPALRRQRDALRTMDGPSAEWLEPLRKGSFLGTLTPEASGTFQACVLRGVTASYTERFARLHLAPAEAAAADRPSTECSPRRRKSAVRAELSCLVFEGHLHKKLYLAWPHLALTRR